MDDELVQNITEDLTGPAQLMFAGYDLLVQKAAEASGCDGFPMDLSYTIAEFAHETVLTPDAIAVYLGQAINLWERRYLLPGTIKFGPEKRYCADLTLGPGSCTPHMFGQTLAPLILRFALGPHRGAFPQRPFEKTRTLESLSFEAHYGPVEGLFAFFRKPHASEIYINDEENTLWVQFTPENARAALS